MATPIILKFGRRVEFDEQSRAFPIRKVIPKGTVPRSYTWSCSIVLDQKDTPACTGFSVAQEAAARPVPVKNVTNAVALAIYKRAQQLDEWPGENYEGSSVLGAIKAGKEKQWYAEYRWAFSEMDLALAVGYKGPAVVGTSWRAGMMEPDVRGFVSVVGEDLGGHAYLITAISLKLDAYKIHNSWGPGWGKNGEAWIKRKDLWTLLKNDGEACIPVVRLSGA